MSKLRTSLKAGNSDALVATHPRSAARRRRVRQRAMISRGGGLDSLATTAYRTSMSNGESVLKIIPSEEAGPVLAHNSDECCGQNGVHGGRNPEDRRVHPLDVGRYELNLRYSGCGFGCTHDQVVNIFEGGIIEARNARGVVSVDWSSRR